MAIMGRELGFVQMHLISSICLITSALKRIGISYLERSKIDTAYTPMKNE
jgi:hypothetical protein